MHSLKTAVDRYLQYLRNERQYSSHTTQNYQKTLEQLQDYLEKCGVNDWHLVSTEQLSQFIVLYRKAGLKASSIQLKLSAIRGFFKFMVHRFGLKVDPSELLVAPKQGRPLPKNLAVDDVSQLLNFTPESTIEWRDKALIELFYSSGLRLTELADLNVVDVKLAEAEVFVTGKGGKQRLLPIGSKALDALKQWLKCRIEFVKTENPALFLSKLGNRLSTRQVQNRLKYWAQKQGMGVQVHPHKLRHSFASHMLESSSDLRAVQELLGHANLSTTQVYTHLDFQHLAKVYDSAHPRAKKNDA